MRRRSCVQTNDSCCTRKYSAMWHSQLHYGCISINRFCSSCQHASRLARRKLTSGCWLRRRVFIPSGSLWKQRRILSWPITRPPRMSMSRDHPTCWSSREHQAQDIISSPRCKQRKYRSQWVPQMMFQSHSTAWLAIVRWYWPMFRRYRWGQRVCRPCKRMCATSGEDLS